MAERRIPLNETDAFFARIDARDARLREEEKTEDARVKAKRIPPEFLRELVKEFREALDPKGETE